MPTAADKKFKELQKKSEAVVKHIRERIRMGRPIPPIDLVFHLTYEGFLNDLCYEELMKRDMEFKRSAYHREKRKDDMYGRITDQHTFFNQAAIAIICSRFYLEF